MSKANRAPSTHRDNAEVADYALPITDNRFDAINIRPGDHLYFVIITDVVPAELDRKLVLARRTRRWGDETVVTEDVWRAKMQPDGTLALSTQSTVGAYGTAVYPSEDVRDVIEIHSRVVGHLQDYTNFNIKPLAELLWTEPVISQPSEAFAHYLTMREIYRNNIEAAASVTFEPETGPTEVDRLCELLFDAALPVIHREPKAYQDAVEAAIAIRDRFFEVGKAEPHSYIDDTIAARLIAGLLSMASPKL